MNNVNWLATGCQQCQIKPVRYIFSSHAGVVIANGSMSSQTSGEGEIRKRVIEEDPVDCMVAMPGQLFYSTQITVCQSILSRDKSVNGLRDRRGEVVLINARNKGHIVS